MAIEPNGRVKPILRKVSTYPKVVPEVDSSEATRGAQHDAEKRHVTFFGQVRVFETIHRDEFTEEELLLSWYRKRDFTMIKAMFAGTVQQLASGTYQGDTDSETARGLEYRHREGAMKRKTNKLNALYAVLDEQERQWRKGYENDEELAAVFIKCNLHCRKAALDLGLRDEEECRLINCLGTDEEDDEDGGSLTSDLSDTESMTLGGDLKKKKKKSSRLKKFLENLKNEKHQ